MDTKIVKVDVSLEQDELFDLFFAISNNVDNHLKTHWINHVTESTEEEFRNKVLHYEASMFTFLETFANLLDRRDLLAGIDYMIKETYQKAKDNNTKESQ